MGVLERLALQFSILFSVTQLYGRKSQPPVNFLNSALMLGPTMSREKDMHSLQMLFSRMAYCKVSGARTTTRFQYNWPCV